LVLLEWAGVQLHPNLMLGLVAVSLLSFIIASCFAV